MELIVSCGGFKGPTQHESISCFLLEAVLCPLQRVRNGKASGGSRKVKVVGPSVNNNVFAKDLRFSVGSCFFVSNGSQLSANIDLSTLGYKILLSALCYFS